jgi:hypothetical protein
VSIPMRFWNRCALSDAAFFAIPNREVCFMNQLDLSG